MCQDGGTEPQKADGKVGYRRPPKEHQFGPGNRAAAGRRKPRSPLNDEVFASIMLEPLLVTIRGRKKRMPAFEALIRTVFQRALAGDPKAVDQMCKYWKLFSFDPSKAAVHDRTDYAAVLRDRIMAMSKRIKEDEADREAELARKALERTRAITS